MSTKDVLVNGWTRYLGHTQLVCDKHGVLRSDQTAFRACMECYGDAILATAKKRREARIEEMKEAIIRAHNELNAKKGKP